MSAPLDPGSRQADRPLASTGDTQLRHLVDSARDAFISIDGTGRVTEWNRQAEVLFGWQRDEALGELLAELIVPTELRDAHLLGLRRFAATGEGSAVFQRLQLPALHRDGRRLEVEFTIWPSRTPDGAWRFHAFLHDAAAERRSERHLRLVQQVAVAANEAHTIEEAVRATLDAVRAATALPVGHAFLLAPDETELRPSGWWSPRPVEPLATATASRTMPLGTGLPGRVAATGHAAWIRDVAVDPNFPRQAAAVASGFRAAFAFPVTVGEEVVAVLELFAGDVSEPTPHLLEVMEVVGTQLGRAFERVGAMEELREAADERRALVSVVSHELRGPLATAHSATSLLRSEVADDHGSAELLDVLDRQLSRLRRLVDDLLTAQRLDAQGAAARPQRIALEPVVRRVVADTDIADVEVDIDGDVLAYVDPDHVEQMVWNLLSNAAAHGAPPIVVAATARPHGTELTVSDAGPGVPAEVLPRMFERFTRGKASAGTGLGLSIVRGLAEANGGRLTYQTEPRPTFVLRLRGADGASG